MNISLKITSYSPTRITNYYFYVGRLQYEGINTAIVEFNEAISDKYNFLQKGFQAMASIQDKKRFKVRI